MLATVFLPVDANFDSDYMERGEKLVRSLIEKHRKADRSK